MKSIFNKNIESVKLLVDYATKNHIILNINDISNNGFTPLIGISANDVDMFNIIKDYANNNDIILDINQKGESDINSLTFAIIKKNIDIIKAYIDYATSKNIILQLNENDLQNNIKDENDDSYNSISKISLEIIKLLHQGQFEKVLDITFSDHSELLERFKEISESV